MSYLLTDPINFFLVEFAWDDQVLKGHVPENAIYFLAQVSPNSLLSVVEVLIFIPIIVVSGVVTGLSSLYFPLLIQVQYFCEGLDYRLKLLILNFVNRW